MTPDDSIIIQVPFCDDRGCMQITLHKMFCGNGDCHSTSFELKGESYRCKKCNTLKSYRMSFEEEKSILEYGYSKEHTTH